MTKFRNVCGHEVHDQCLEEMLTVMNKYGYSRALIVMAYCTAIFITESETHEERLMWANFMKTLAIMIPRIPLKFTGGSIDESSNTIYRTSQSGEEVVEETQCDGSGI